MTTQTYSDMEVKVNGITFKSLTEAARHYGVSKQTISRQVERLGLALIYIPGERVGPGSKRWQADTFGAETDTVQEQPQAILSFADLDEVSDLNNASDVVECAICGQPALEDYNGSPRCAECLSYEHAHDERVAIEKNNDEADAEAAERDRAEREAEAAAERRAEMQQQVDGILRKFEEIDMMERQMRAEQEQRVKDTIVGSFPPLSRIVYLLTAEVSFRPDSLTIETMRDLPGAVQVKLSMQPDQLIYIAGAAIEPFTVTMVRPSPTTEGCVEVCWCCRIG